MDLIRVIEELESEIEGASRIPMTGKLFIDEDVILDYIDRIRAMIPEEVRQAQWVTKERERILSDAQAEAENIVAKATAYIDEQACNSEIVRKAEIAAQERLSKVSEEAAEIEMQAKAYAMNVLQKLETTLGKAIDAVKEGQHQVQHLDDK